MRTFEIRIASGKLMKTCWAETAFISLINLGIFWIEYLLIIFMGRLTGVHTADTIAPFFNSLTVPFVIAAFAVHMTFRHLTAPIYYGTKWFFWQASEGNIMPVSSIFAGYSSASQFRLCVRLRAQIAVRKLPSWIAFGAAAAAEIFLADLLISLDSTDSKKMLVFICFSCSAAAVLTVFLINNIKYIPVGYLLADDPDANISDIIDLSLEIFRKKYISIMKLYLSMWSWIVLCVLVFPILAFMPYVNMTSAFFVHQCMKELQLKKSKVREPSA